MSTVLDRSRIAAAPSSVDGAEEILTPEAMEFLGELHLRFNERRLALLEARAERQKRFDAGKLPDFPEETSDTREGDW
jgi:malate synthase